jgi:hypothetical protein
MLGGKPEKAKEYFEKCLSISNGNFLLAKLFYAKTYAVQVQDQPLFESLLKQIDEASLDALPDVRLANAVAKQKAKRLSGRTNDLF